MDVTELPMVAEVSEKIWKKAQDFRAIHSSIFISQTSYTFYVIVIPSGVSIMQQDRSQLATGT